MALVAALALVGVPHGAPRVERPVELEEGLRAIVRGASPGSIRIRLPDGDVVVARRRELDRTGVSAPTWLGDVRGGSGELFGSVALAVREGAARGTVVVGEHRWRLCGDGTTVALTAFAPHRSPDGRAHACDGGVAVALASSGSLGSTTTTRTRLDERDPVGGGSGPGSSVADVLVAWTPEAEAAAGGSAAIQAICDLAVLETNQALEQSGVTLRVNLVQSAPVAYVESGDMATDLARLRDPADGYMDEIHAWRDAYGADVVSLLVANEQACGRSYNMGAPASLGFASYAFDLVSQGCATGEYALAHELGHGFGLDHDRTNTSNVPSHPYAYGFWTANGVYRTIMGLPRWGVEGVRIPYFSNPDLKYAGNVLGVASGSYAADCARALDDNMTIVSAWRPTVNASTRLEEPCATGRLLLADAAPAAGSTLAALLDDPEREVPSGSYPVVVLAARAAEPDCDGAELAGLASSLVSYRVGTPWDGTLQLLEVPVPAGTAGAELVAQPVWLAPSGTVALGAPRAVAPR